MSGATHLTGYEDEPIKAYSPYVDYGTASLTAMGTQLQLLTDKNCRGQVVEGALCYFRIHEYSSHRRGYNNKNRKAIGNKSPYAGPVDIVKLKMDGLLSKFFESHYLKDGQSSRAEDFLDDDRFSLILKEEKTLKF